MFNQKKIKAAIRHLFIFLFIINSFVLNQSFAQSSSQSNNSEKTSNTAKHRIINGKKVTQGQYPWMVALLDRYNKDNPFDAFDYPYQLNHPVLSDRYFGLVAGIPFFVSRLPLLYSPSLLSSIYLLLLNKIIDATRK